ncbi:MAG: sigma-70 family RNA polymerase sigma factor [Bacteroidales bacterium]|nr:sigma-70 family RNA polymerase sigma factor [Bacteroidales bacterium]
MDIEHQIRLHYKRMCIYALHFVSDPAAVEDIVLEAFVGLWQNQDQVRDVKAYLFASVRNRCLNYLRNQRLLSSESIPEELVSEDSSDDAEVDFRIWSVLDALPEKMREAYLLSKRDGMSYDDIAVRMGVSIHTIRNQIAKASKKIRHILEKY